MNIAKLTDKNYSENYRNEEIRRQAELLIDDLVGESFKNKQAKQKKRRVYERTWKLILWRWSYKKTFPRIWRISKLYMWINQDN